MADETKTLRHQMHRAFGHAVSSVVRRLRQPITLGARLFATNAAGEVLLVRQSYTPGFVLPGGGVDPGETCAEAALREAREEAGLVRCDAPSLFSVYLNPIFGGRDHIVLYVAQNAVLPEVPKRSLEIREIGFFAPDSLPPETSKATKARIDEVIHGLTPSDTW